MFSANKLKELRTLKKLSQAELAEKLKVSHQAVAKWETGDSFPGIDKLESLSQIFSLPIDVFFNDEKSSTENKNVSRTFVCGQSVENYAAKLVKNSIEKSKNIIVADCNRNIYNDSIDYLTATGYTVKVLDMQDTKQSDGYNILSQISRLDAFSIDCLVDLFFDIFSNDYDRTDKTTVCFEKGLFKSILYAVYYDESKKFISEINIHDVCKIILNNCLSKIIDIIDKYPDGSSCRKYFPHLASNSEECDKVICGLKLRVSKACDFINFDITDKTGITKDIIHNDKTAYFIISNSNDAKFNFLISHFFIRLAIVLNNEYYDTCCPVNIIINDIMNINRIEYFFEKAPTFCNKSQNRIQLFTCLQDIDYSSKSFHKDTAKNIFESFDRYIILDKTYLGHRAFKSLSQELNVELPEDLDERYAFEMCRNQTHFCVKE